MLKTGTVPVSDEIHRLPAVGNSESKSLELHCVKSQLIAKIVAPVHAEEDEEEELRKLQAEMAM